jgi:hypothetical protein
MMTESFDSLEELFSSMQAREATANANLSRGQVRLRDEVDATHYVVMYSQGVVIFGVVPPLSEVIAEEHGLIRQIADEQDASLSREEQAEMESAAVRLTSSRRRGYLFGRWFSVVEPDGELGSNHVSNVISIGRDAFEQAKAEGWMS